MRWYLEVSCESQQSDIRARLVGVVFAAAKFEEEVHREANLEVNRRVDVQNLFRTELNSKRLDVTLQMFDLTASDDWVYEWVFAPVRVCQCPSLVLLSCWTRCLPDIRQRNRCNGRVLALSNSLEFLRNLDVLVRRGPKVATLLVAFALGLGSEVAAAQCAPGAECHSFLARHGDDLALEVTLRGGPATLVNGEGAETVIASVWHALVLSCCDLEGTNGYSHWLALLTTQAGVSLTPRYRTLPRCTMWLSDCISSGMLVVKSHQWT